MNSEDPKTETGAKVEQCETDAACEDNLFCNGQEKCEPSSADAGEDGCVPGELACENGGRCLEEESRCAGSCSEEPDADKDGHAAIACGGDDCDDTDPNRFPGNNEICDAEAHDEDCDPATFGERDEDRDGYVDALCCNTSPEGDTCGDDCDDSEEGTHPSEAENCDGIDNDCDGDIDEGFECALGSAGRQCTTESGLEGLSACSATCSFEICRAPEICNGIDDDHDNVIDEGFLCVQDAINIPCTTACGTSGMGSCNSECSAYQSCVAGTELCNYCDDNGVSGISEEKPMATYSETVAMRDAYVELGLAESLEPTPSPNPGTSSSFYWQLTPGIENFEVGGIRFAEGSHMGWKGVEVEVSIQVYGPPAGVFGPEPNYGGWGISLVTDADGQLGSTHSGGVSGALGFEWNWGRQDLYSGNPDTSDASRLHGVVDNTSYHFGDGSIPSSAQERSDQWTTQRLYLKYTPDDPSTGADEESLLIKNGRNGTQILSVAGSGGRYELDNEIPVGQSFAVMVSAASNARPFKAKLHAFSLYIDDYSPDLEYTDAALVSIDGLCPP